MSPLSSARRAAISALSSAMSPLSSDAEFGHVGLECSDIGFGGDAVAEGGADGVGDGFGLGRGKAGLGQGLGGVQGIEGAHRLFCLSTGGAKRNPPRRYAAPLRGGEGKISLWQRGRRTLRGVAECVLLDPGKYRFLS